MTQPQQKTELQSDIEAEAQDQIQDHMEDTPSWFSRTYGASKPQDMASQYRDNLAAQQAVPHPIVAEHAAAYEAYRKRLEERFATAQRLADPQFGAQDNVQSARQTAFPQRPNYAHDMLGQQQQQIKPRRAAGFNPAMLAILTLAACGLGGGAGYVAANPDKANELAQQGQDFIGGLWFKPADVASETVIEKKTIRTARLEVKDASGAINSPIPLDIAALAADADTPVALRISGLPPSAYLTKGVEVSKGEWMLKATDIGSAELVVPHTDLPEISLQVAALEEKTGAPAAPTQDLNVSLDTKAVPVPGVPQPKSDGPQIIPASAMADQGFNKLALPPAIPVPLESANPEAQGFIVKGDSLMQSGDLLAARQFYLRAFGLKASSAAYGVGQTYDPAVYAKFKIKGLAPDAQLAAEWYGKAAAVGHSDASAALAQLPAQP